MIMHSLCLTCVMIWAVTVLGKGQSPDKQGASISDRAAAAAQEVVTTPTNSVRQKSRDSTTQASNQEAKDSF